MCDDHDATDAHIHGLTPSRRTVLKAAAFSSLSAAVLNRVALVQPASAATIDGAFSMAMHIHSSFSEGYGSMDAHLQQATLNNVDVIWWTDHDTKMNGLSDKHVVHFSSLTGETGDGPAWQWQLKKTGSLTSASTGGIVATPAAPADPVAQGSLQVAAQSTGAPRATLGFSPEPVPSQQTWRTNLAGQTLSIEVMPTSISTQAYLEVFILSSYHPATGGRTAGQYTLSYRIGGAGRPGTRTINDRLGIVTLPSTVGSWNSLVLRPEADLAALFPDLDSRDFSLHSLTLRAASSGGATSSGYFDYLRFARQTTGEVALQVQDDMMASYSSKYPAITQRNGLEVSHALPHINWFGGAITLPDYSGVSGSQYTSYLSQTVILQIHTSGGLASYNHPYGVGFGPPLSVSAQDDLRRTVAIQLLSNKALGADILEVGYPLRAGVDIAHHVGLWDICSRNALFLTGNGVSDDHAGTNWAHPQFGLTWITMAWAPNAGETALLNALRSGRVWCGSQTLYRGALDLLVDGSCPMGSVSVSGLPTRSLLVTATDVPTGGSVEIVQGVVDYAGTSAPSPATSVVATYTSTQLQAGSVDLAVDTTQSSFVRSQVRNASGTVVGLSNPAWLLRETPPNGLPAARAA